MIAWRGANCYMVVGAAFGLCFPLFSIAFLSFLGTLDFNAGVIELVRSAHRNPLLYVIDTAPIFLGFAARLAGVRQDRLRELAESLEQQVQIKTESLRTALAEAREANALISYLAEHDPLTGLLNRRHFQEAVAKWMLYGARYQRPGTLIFIDLDKFKFINDSYGHKAGDQYLISTARLLTNTLRNTDIIARWGGDEFVAFLPDIDGPTARNVANKLLAAFTQASFSYESHLFQPSVSMGLASAPEHTRDMHELVMCADAAMYEAKKAGRGCWRLYGGSTSEVDHVQAHLQWEARIRRALSNDQFVLLYQPLINLRTGATEGYEALLRMEDADGQLISPGIFLESAERAELTTSIDMMVTRKALRRIAPLDKVNRRLWVSINLSPKTLRDKTLPAQLDALLEAHSDQATRLRFEVSEVDAIQNLALVTELAAQIRDLGGALLIDDFGLGSRAVQHLADLPIDMVKLHPALIRDLMHTPDTRLPVKHLTDALHGLKLQVAAKSIEDPKSLDLLRALGIDFAQGFAVGRPLESIEQASQPGYILRV